MRDYINEPVHIDGRNIPYPIYTDADYLKYHDNIDEEKLDGYRANNMVMCKTISQIMAIKQSCFLLRHTSYSCQSLSDNLYELKIRLIKELKEKYNYEFDDEWVEKQWQQ